MGSGQYRQINAILIQRADFGAQTQAVNIVVMRARNELRQSGRPAGQLQERDLAGIGAFLV